MLGQALSLPGYYNISGSDLYWRQSPHEQEILSLARRKELSLRSITERLQDSAQRVGPMGRAGPELIQHLDDLMVHFTPETRRVIASGGDASRELIRNGCDVVADRHPSEDLQLLTVKYATMPTGYCQALRKFSPREFRSNLRGILLDPRVLAQGHGLRWHATLELDRDGGLPSDWVCRSGEFTVAVRHGNRTKVGFSPARTGDRRKFGQVIDPLYEAIRKPEQLARVRDFSEAIEKYELQIIAGAVLVRDRPDLTIAPVLLNPYGLA